MKCIRSLMAFILGLCLLCAQALAEESPVIVSVDAIEFTCAEVQAYYDTLAKSACESNDVSCLTQEQAEQLRDAVVKQYIFQGVVQNQYVKLGLDTFTAEDEAALREDAAQQYDALVDATVETLRENYPGVSEEKLRAYAASTLDLQDVTVDTVFAAARETAILERMLDYAAPGLEVAEAQIDAAYVEQYIATEEKAFGDNIYMWELYRYSYDFDARYIPSGFRYVKQILLATPENLQKELDAQQAVIDATYEAVATTEAALGAITDADDDATKQAASDASQEANRAYDAALSGYEAICQRVLDAVKPTTDEIMGKLDAGSSFDSLMDAYTIDEEAHSDAVPFMVHAESVFCDETLRDAAMALEKPGDVSAPIWTSEGVHLLYYAADAPAYVPMDDAMHEAIKETLYDTYRYDALMEQASAWQADYAVFSYPDKIDMTYATTEHTVDAAE